MGDYFDLRSGDTWDLFFPGYFASTRSQRFEEQCGSHFVGRVHGKDWYFSAQGFDELRRHVSESSSPSDHGQWSYSGCEDLVIVNAYLSPTGGPHVDWMSCASGKLIGPSRRLGMMSLGEVVEEITNDLEGAIQSPYHGKKDPHYGVGPVVAPGREDDPQRVPRDVIIAVLTVIAAKILGTG